MKKVSAIALSLACLVAASSARADLNLVQDPGFSSGWTGALTATSGIWVNPGYFPGVTSQDNVSIAANPLAPSSYNAVLAPAANQNAVLFQFMSLAQGAKYDLGFWLATPSAAGGILTVDLNGKVAGVIDVAGNTPFTEYNMLASAGSASGILNFVWNPGGGAGTLEMDDISLISAVPDDMGIATGALMLLPLVARMLRKRSCKRPIILKAQYI